MKSKIIILFILIIVLFILKKKILKENLSDKNVFDTYGTITDKGIKLLIKHLKINNNDIFLDAGCGKGNVVRYFSQNTPIKKSIGIEYLKERYDEAIKNTKNINSKKEIKIINGNMYDKENENLFLEATIIFTCSTCFKDELLNHITDLCSKNKKLKYFITQKKLFNNNLKFLKTIVTSCSWNDKCEHHIYTKL